MKKILVLLTAACLMTGMSFAHEGGDKGKGKGKKSSTQHCPGKECSKKKG